MPSISPTLPSQGGLRGTEELVELAALTTIRDTLNGLLDTANLVAGVFASQAVVFEHAGFLTQFNSTTETGYTSVGTSVSFPSSSPILPGLVVESGSPWALTGRTPKLAVEVSASSNGGTDAFGTAINVALKSVTFAGTGGLMQVSLGSSVASLTVNTLQNLTGVNRVSNIAVPAAGLYIFTATAPVAIPANGLVALNFKVGLYYV